MRPADIIEYLAMVQKEATSYYQAYMRKHICIPTKMPPQVVDAKHLMENVFFDLVHSSEEIYKFKDREAYNTIRALAQKLCNLRKELINSLEEPECSKVEDITKEIADVDQILLILKMHFSMMECRGYRDTKVPMTDILNDPRLTEYDPRCLWEFLPACILEKCFGHFGFQSMPALYMCKRKNEYLEDLESLLYHLTETVRPFNAEVFFTKAGFEKFCEIFRKEVECHSYRIKSFSYVKPEEVTDFIKIGYTFGNIGNVNFELVFDMLEDGSRRLVAYTYQQDGKDKQKVYLTMNAASKPDILKGYDTSKSNLHLIDHIVVFDA